MRSSNETGYRDGGDEQPERIEVTADNTFINLPCNGIVSRSTITAPEACDLLLTFSLADDAPEFVRCPRCGATYFPTSAARAQMLRMVSSGKGEISMMFLNRSQESRS
jgi:hypothetical protein